jgi:hypothetical protein
LTEYAWDVIVENQADSRRTSNHVAAAHRYQCESSDRYDFPPGDRFIAGRMTSAERELAFGESVYVAFVMTKGNPVCRLARLACERNLSDLAKSYAAE